MFVPLKDENPLVLIPFEIVNVGLIAIWCRPDAIL